MRIRDIMDAKVQAASWVTDAEQAMRTLLLRDLCGLAVVKDGAIVGTVCLGDFGDAKEASSRKGKTLEQFAVPAATVGNARISMRKAQTLMRRNRVDRLAVLKGHKLVGMFNAGWSDLGEGGEQAEDTERMPKERGRVAIRTNQIAT